jgi:hypothetical protein
MTRDHLREQIAAEAARLLLRGKERDFAAARKRAARWLRRQRLHRDELPSNAEIQVQMYALAGVMSAERDPATLYQMRHLAWQLAELLADFSPRCAGAVAEGPVTPGADVVLEVQGEIDAVYTRLQAAGLRGRREVFTASQAEPSCQTAAPPPAAAPHPAADPAGVIRLKHNFPVEIRVFSGPLPPQPGRLTIAKLRQQLTAAAAVDEFFPVDGHPEAYDVFRLLLEPLARVQLDPETHPEGDALYHSLQVFELGRQHRPYDEEFLLACLLHDVGWGIDPRHPVLSGIDALGSLITERTRYLIEQRPAASRYLQTGECPRSLRKSEEFEDVVLLARCDRDGRVPGQPVPTLDEALDYLAGLAAAWDEPA